MFKGKYIKFSRTFEDGSEAPWLIGYYRQDQEEVTEVFYVCEKCNKQERFDIDENIHLPTLTFEREQFHKRCGLN